jgi:parafibromin
MPKRVRDNTEWVTFVDAVVAKCDAEKDQPFDFNQDWEPDLLLPDVPVTEAILDYVRSSREELSEENQSVFYRRLPLSESFHPMPKRPTETEVFSKKARKQLPGLGEHEGEEFSDFLTLARTEEISKASTKAALLVAMTPPRGLLGTAVKPRVAPLASLGTQRKACDFVPIILVPNSHTSILQMWNIKEFLESGVLRSAADYFLNPDGSAKDSEKPTSVLVRPTAILASLERFNVKFRHFKVVDDEDQVKNWDHVCAAFVTGQEWQLSGWYGGDSKKTEPSFLFSNVRGFMPFYEEDRAPMTVDQWKVHKLIMSRKLSRSYIHVEAARAFWEETFKFMDVHAHFRQYTLPAEDDLVGSAQF